MKESHKFDHGASKEQFDKLGEYMDANDFSCVDFLAVVCAHLVNYPQHEFETELMVGGIVWNIKLTKEKGRGINKVVN